MKLIVGAAVLDAVDRGEVRLSDEIMVGVDDISPGPEEFANVVLQQGRYTATLEELLRRSIVDSDSTSVDSLLPYIGGIPAVQHFIKRKAISGIRIDRTERELQTESVGLSWKPEYSDLKKFDASVKSLPVDKRNEAWHAHSIDIRDRATPIGMAEFLSSIMRGQLLSASSTEKLVNIMIQTAAGKDRLRAGLRTGWKIGHKTGTGLTWQGETETTNDVGILISPDGILIAIAVFLARSNAPASEQASVIARVSRLVCNHYGTKRTHSQ